MNTKDKQGLGLIVFVSILFFGILFFQMQPSEKGCPSCNQHYLFIDNSEAVSPRDLKKLAFDNNRQGLLSRVWAELEVGDQLNILAFDPRSLDTVFLSQGELVKQRSPEDVNELIQSRKLVEKSFAVIEDKVRQVLKDLPSEGMSQTNIMKGLYDLGVAINNHRASHKRQDGSDFGYRIILVSDLLEHSDLYDAYSADRPEFDDWVDGSKSRAGLASLSGVEVNIYQVQRGVMSQNLALDKFWQRYFSASGARPLTFGNF